MKNKTFATVFILLSFSLLFFSCISEKEPKTFNQLDLLTKEDIQLFKQQVIRYIGRKPEDASHKNKFHPYFDAHYEKQKMAHELNFYRQDKNDSIYFVFTRIAPSIQLKKVAIGGVVLIDQNTEEVTYLKEVFRTWKQVPDSLIVRAEELFVNMLQGKSLNKFMTEESGNMDYIEFPNSEVWYNTDKREWVSSREDVLEVFYDEKIQRTQQYIDSLDNI